MLVLPPPDIASALRDFAVGTGLRPPLEVVLGTATALRLEHGDRRFFFGSLSDGREFGDIVGMFRSELPREFDEIGIHEVVVGVAGMLASDVVPVTIARGVRILPLQEALASLVGMPRAWRSQQIELLAAVLQPVATGNGFQVVDLRSDDGRIVDDALAEAPVGKLIYLRADAGKGKSTVLAWRTQRHVQERLGSVPSVFVSLRELKRSEGVSWAAVAARLGVLGADADVLAAAVRVGLIHVSLDGLDEVAGRYDPTIVADVLRLLRDTLLGPRARVLLSGRTTESGLLESVWAFQVGLRLPEPNEPDFARFVETVSRQVTPGWAELFGHVPEPVLGVQEPSKLPKRPPSDNELKLIQEWVQVVFEDLGKDRSLFFVQSLVGAARTYQLDGNRPLLIRSSGQPPRLTRPSVYDTARLAASLACVRELDKVEPIARDRFSAQSQLKLLTWFAVLASAPDTIRNQLPSPNTLTREAFAVDPTHENEVFTALIRQMHKHALLYAAGGEGKAADWRPAFLSHWTRNALLVRAWQHRHGFPGVSFEVIARALACSERAEIAFKSLFVEELNDAELADLGRVLRQAADEQSAEASANFWRLYASLEPERRSILGSVAALAEMADLSNLEVAGLDAEGLLGNLVVFCEAQIADSSFVGLDLTSCDLTGVVFTGCDFVGGRIAHSTGPCLFEDCTFQDVTIEDFEGRGVDLVKFVRCDFRGSSKIVQTKPPSGGEYFQVYSFDGCIAERPDELLAGEWLGVDPRRVAGLGILGGVGDMPREQFVLRATLKTFFPARAGEGRQRQARPYIRSSALGRGTLPDGAPSGETLFRILRTVGFTDGGRDRHLYAPWSGVVGGGEAAFKMRSELLDFMTNGTSTGVTVNSLLAKIRREAGW